MEDHKEELIPGDNRQADTLTVSKPSSANDTVLILVENRSSNGNYHDSQVSSTNYIQKLCMLIKKD